VALSQNGFVSRSCIDLPGKILDGDLRSLPAIRGVWRVSEGGQRLGRGEWLQRSQRFDWVRRSWRVMLSLGRVDVRVAGWQIVRDNRFTILMS
jgi:hypothetical protein